MQISTCMAGLFGIRQCCHRRELRDSKPLQFKVQELLSGLLNLIVLLTLQLLCDHSTAAVWGIMLADSTQLLDKTISWPYWAGWEPLQQMPPKTTLRSCQSLQRLQPPLFLFNSEMSKLPSVEATYFQSRSYISGQG